MQMALIGDAIASKSGSKSRGTVAATAVGVSYCWLILITLTNSSAAAGEIIQRVFRPRPPHNQCCLVVTCGVSQPQGLVCAIFPTNDKRHWMDGRGSAAQRTASECRWERRWVNSLIPMAARGTDH